MAELDEAVPGTEPAHVAPARWAISALSTPLRSHLLLSLAFVAARLLLYAAGLRLYFDLSWMWLADPAWLRDHFWHTLLYFHAMPPGMNVLTALCFALGGARAPTVALVLFAAFGLVLSNSILYVARRLLLSEVTPFCLALAFSLTPAALYFDHLFIYESPVVALLALSAVLFWRGMKLLSFRAWLAFFLCSASIGLIRTTFHLVWLVALVTLAALLCPRGKRRTLLVAAAGPALLLTALYAKNWLLFGLFDAFSEGPVSLNLVTTKQLPRAERDTWIAEGKLSPYAALGVFAGPREYLPFFKSAENPAFPPELSLLERPTTGAPNFNHWFYLEVMPVRRRDAFVYLRERPWQYLHTVQLGLRDFFSATTRWHPYEAVGHGTPHDQHRTVLGRYETLYNRVLHSFPLAPVGWYAFLPLPLAWAAFRARALGRESDAEQRARGALLWLMLFQVGYVVASSTLFTFQESSRYRFQIEPYLWLITAAALAHAWQQRERFRPQAAS